MSETSTRHVTITVRDDCGCETSVYGDGSGHDTYRCSLHDAAGDLLAVCKAALDRENERDTPAFSSLRARLRCAIAKAEGQE